MKYCTKCHKIKSLLKFHISKIFKDKHNNWCKKCMKKYHKKYRTNPEVRKRELISCRKQYLLHKDIILKRSKEWKQNNKEKINKYKKNYEFNRKRIDINYKILHNLRTRVNAALKGNPKLETTMNLIGCSIEQLKEHLQKQFKFGMSWSNYGEWHIDHIKPCVRFNLSNQEEQKKCFHYTNLQPLWAKDNLKKKDK